MITRRVRSIIAVTATAVALVLAGCGDDDGGGADGGDTEIPAPTVAGEGADDDPPTDDGDLGPIATGLRVSLQADRVEVDGDTIHIYVKESDGVVAGAGSECIVASAVVPEGTTVVVHRDGGETTC